VLDLGSLEDWFDRREVDWDNSPCSWAAVDQHLADSFEEDSVAKRTRQRQ
jgi:hypothetical protein